VYDLYGKFKRCLSLDREVSSIFDYDKDNLICYDMSVLFPGDFTNISPLFSSRIISLILAYSSAPCPRRFISNYSYQIRLSNGKCTLMDTSADTLYNYASAGTLSPFVVRTPSMYP